MTFQVVVLSAILEQFVASVGVPKIESFSYRSLSVVQTGQGEVTALAQAYFAAPDRYREDATMSFGKIVTIRHGDEAWAATPRGVSELTADQRRRTMEHLYRNYLGLLWAAADGRVEAVETETGEWILRVDGFELRASFDESTGRLVQISMPGSNLAGAVVTEKRVFSEFDPDTNLPNRVHVYQDDELAAEITIKTWSVNDALAPELFERPEDEEEKEREP